ncbi:MAG: hypothetical protein K2F88_09530, partial [Duncaniella sp.]|nr:hypothetical protein [Duncaniella sp.]
MEEARGLLRDFLTANLVKIISLSKSSASASGHGQNYLIFFNFSTYYHTLSGGLNSYLFRRITTGLFRLVHRDHSVCH